MPSRALEVVLLLPSASTRQTIIGERSVIIIRALERVSMAILQ